MLDTAAWIHDDIRRTQQSLVEPSLARQFGVVKNVASLAPWSGWLELGAGGWSDATLLSDVVVAGGVPLLRLVADRSLEAWVPSRRQLDEAAAAMRLRVEQSRRSRANPDTSPDRDTSSGATVTVDGQRLAPSIPSRTLGAGIQRR